MIPELVLLVILSIINGIGLLINGFIVTVNMFWWLKHQTLQTINVLITSLGLVRLGLLVLSACDIFFMVSGLSLLVDYTHPEYLATLTMCLMFCSLWWGSLLYVFYCVKITNYGNRLFMRLKMKISKMVPWLLLISLLISFLSSLPYKWVVLSSPVVNGTDHGIIKLNIVNLFIMFFVGSAIPFILCCVAVYLIVLSLRRHIRNMSSRDSGFSDAQRDIHLSVIRSMVSFLLFFALYFAAFLVIPAILHLKIPALFCGIWIRAYPSLHSIYVLVSNKEMRDSFFLVFSCTWLLLLKQQTP